MGFRSGWYLRLQALLVEIVDMGEEHSGSEKISDLCIDVIMHPHNLFIEMLPIHLTKPLNLVHTHTDSMES